MAAREPAATGRSGAEFQRTELWGYLEKGDKQFLNAVGGIRPVLTEYDEPDTVLMLELNWERAGRDDFAIGQFGENFTVEGMLDP